MHIGLYPSRYLPISSSPHGHGAAAVGFTRDECAISVRFHGYFTGTERQPCDNCARAVRMSHDFTIAVRLVFGNMTTENRAFAARSERGVRTASERRPYGDCAMAATICRANSRFRPRPKSASVRESHGDSLPPHGGRTEREITGSLPAP